MLEQDTVPQFDQGLSRGFVSFSREISVLIEPREDGPVDMLITYVVTRCLWKPAYDIRLFNSDGSMKVSFQPLLSKPTSCPPCLIIFLFSR